MCSRVWRRRIRTDQLRENVKGLSVDFGQSRLRCGVANDDELPELAIPGVGRLAGSLEDAIGAYERGADLKKHCEKKLTEAKARVEKINLSATGAESLEPADLE